jgi:protease I
MLTWSGFQDHEVIYPYYALKEHGFDVTVVGDKRDERINGILGAFIYCDRKVEWLKDGTVNEYNILVIPGGVKALEKLRLQQPAVDFVKKWFEQDKMVFSICNGAQLLITADVLRGRKCSGYYSIQKDIENAGAEYVNAPAAVDGNLVSCPHYDFMGDWLSVGFDEYEKRNKS